MLFDAGSFKSKFLINIKTSLPRRQLHLKVILIWLHLIHFRLHLPRRIPLLLLLHHSKLKLNRLIDIQLLLYLLIFSRGYYLLKPVILPVANNLLSVLLEVDTLAICFIIFEFAIDPFAFCQVD